MHFFHNFPEPSSVQPSIEDASSSTTNSDDAVVVVSDEPSPEPSPSEPPTPSPVVMELPAIIKRVPPKPGSPEEEEEEIIRCVCNIYRDEGKMIQCDKCQVG